MIRVLIVDDHKIVRQGLNAIIETEPNMAVVGECTDGTEVIEFVSSNDVDIVIMDVLMQNQDGITTTQKLRLQYPDLKVLALSMQSDYNTIQKMLNAGANGYAIKNTSAKEIIDAINKVYSGSNYFSKDVTSSIMLNMMGETEITKKSQDNNSLELINKLTSREIEVLKHIANEETNEEIALKLTISAGTVSTHRRNLIQKLEVRNSIGLAKLAFQYGIVE